MPKWKEYDTFQSSFIARLRITGIAEQVPPGAPHFGRICRLCGGFDRRKNSCEHISALILEGNPAQSLSVGMHPHAFKGGLLSVALDWGVPVLFSENAADTALLLWLMQEKHGPLRKEVSIRPGRRPKRFRNRQLFVLQGLPSVGPKVGRCGCWIISVPWRAS